MIRWGVVGPGEIAAGFAEAMRWVVDGEIVAVASRSIARATAFGDRFRIPTRYDDYAALAADPDVDVVYVATPASRHEQDTVTFLEAGKHILCEKPFAINARQARQMAEHARARGLFLMEAIWSRFLPTYRSLVDVLASGRIGQPLLVEADFGMRWPIRPEHRLFDPDLGGGALLDLGIYPVQLCSLVLGSAEHVAAAGVIGETGVDEQVAAVLRHARGALGVVKAAIRVTMTCTARIAGTDGSIDLPAFMHCPNALTVTTRPGGAEHIDGSYEGNGLQFEIAEVHRCLLEGLTESPVMPLDETIALASTLDAIRAQVLTSAARSRSSVPAHAGASDGRRAR
ncbi:Gfo/Idh/MocA family oxidoreductase [Pseudofrankia sp. BMG5.37]|uniref:Gfo/Idh/MocA family protein n=1 Tax=Pseudofrankia sp. BMG5.37 TaxID=3050035 RepID=UPI002894CCBE|nr:Gfo/Idh/MocA family oxidoreductase [Pseudofrankia sp. BMG5.37]MDT3446599.1 Gfo/Idh/MocA family oxidoreductase [Pseudofrankia sp. BMG5.37]